MKKIHITIIALIMVAATFAFIDKKPETRVYVSNNSLSIQKIIEIWSKSGFKVQSITSQNVSVSINQYYTNYYNAQYREMKGDLILIMTKN